MPWLFLFSSRRPGKTVGLGCLDFGNLYHVSRCVGPFVSTGGFLVGAIAVDVADEERSPLSDHYLPLRAGCFTYPTYVWDEESKYT